MSARVSFTITTHWNRPPGEPGFTSLDSKRLTAGTALEWILRELPGDAVTVVTADGDATLIAIEWAKVPAEIRDGRP